MSLSPDTLTTISRLQYVATRLKSSFARRDTAVDLVILALVSREHLLFLGPQGTAKSDLVERFAHAIQCETFHYLLTHFTDTAELCGAHHGLLPHPDRTRTRTDGFLPSARIVLLDDVFQINSLMINSLITLLQNRVFHNGFERLTVPLISLFATSRHLPDDLSLRGFSDRFLLRLRLEPVQDAALGELLSKGWALEMGASTPTAPEPSLAPEDLDNLYRALPDVAIAEIAALYQGLLRHLRAEGIDLSDRRIVKGLKLIRAAALLDGRDEATPRDLWPLTHVWSTPEEAVALRDVIQPLIEEAGGPVLEARRPLEDLREELALLVAYAPNLRGEEMFTAHLTALGQLRRDVIFHAPRSNDLLTRLEAEIERILTVMEHQFFHNR